ncbi:hypothetical protein [Burkholderia pyrrocinia]|uniref:hypothetical protein n=1 Tax=Burkholderia pyrrocinia TaxID=60550 RepID=UPI00158D8A1E|nr:hypothetical protein [Burkholderia pyrrocinia]
MTPSPLVPVEGALARPRIAPLDHVPPFGREWTFRGAPGARPGKHCLATLTTSCIDVDRPHRACRWQPWPTAASAPQSAGLPVTPAAVADTRSRRTVRGARDRRAMYAICWSVGAFGIIGWLIAAHEPFTGFEPAHTIQMGGIAPDHATSSTATMRVAAVQPDTPTYPASQRTVATPVAKTAESPPATYHAAPRPASLRPKATSDVQPTATASPRRTSITRTTAAPTRSPTVPHLAARPPVLSDTADARTRDRLASPPHAPDTRDARDTLDDPLTLIAMANALRGAQPARSAPAPDAGFDWTSQLSHRRVTDAPDAFAH